MHSDASSGSRYGGTVAAKNVNPVVASNGIAATTTVPAGMGGSDGATGEGAASTTTNTVASSGRSSGGSNSNSSSAAAPSLSGRKRLPQAETNAEAFYYKKQMETHTPMVIVLIDGEEIEGTIEWYDRNALKVNRKSAPNIMLLKQTIKYMYKAEDRESDG